MTTTTTSARSNGARALRHAAVWAGPIAIAAPLLAAGFATAVHAEPASTDIATTKRHSANTRKIIHAKTVAARDAQYQAVAEPTPPPAPVYLPAPLLPISAYFNSLPLPAKDGSLTYKGITVYGGVDLGVGYQSHGAPLSSFQGQGRNEQPNAANTHTQVGFVPNALSNSNLGVKAVEEIIPGLSAVFNYQLQFNPQSLQLQNGPKSLVNNNGVPVGQRTSGSDSSKAGQFDNALLYGGLASTTLGTITFGRQNSLTLDAVNAYDPMSGSNAFSLIGTASMTAGAGNSQDARYNDSLKYRVNVGPFRGAATYKFDDFGESRRNAYAAQIGGEYAGFSGDVIYTVVHDSIAASSLSAVQNTPANFNTLAGTISDNSAVMAVASYKINDFKFYAGYENIRFANPSNGGLPPGSADLGYRLSFTTNNAYNVNRKVDVFWGGVKYSVTPKLDLVGAYYHYTQNNYASGLAAIGTVGTIAGCAANSRFAASCAGTQDAASILVDYRISKNFDIYAGAMYGIVHGGFASGFYANTVAGPAGLGTNGTRTGAATNTIDPTVGARFQF